MTVFGKTYASAYDAMYAEKDYEGEVDLLEAAFERFGSRVESVLDLGCGTGNHLAPLARRGYEVAGVDRSADIAADSWGRGCGGTGCDSRELDDGCGGAAARSGAGRFVGTRLGHDATRVVSPRREHHPVLGRPGVDQVRVDMERIALDPLRGELIRRGV